MQAITEFAARVNAAFDTIGVKVDGITEDVNWLKAEVTRLQTELPPESAALLAGLETRLSGLVTRVGDLDDATVPPVPQPTP